MTIIYCRRPTCGASYGSGGDLPLNCPSCKHPAWWGTSPPESQAPPAKGLAFSHSDRKFLREIRINPDA